MTLRYVILDHRRIDGVTLSKLGDWGGIRYPDDASAEAAARKHAGRQPIEIERISR